MSRPALQKLDGLSLADFEKKMTDAHGPVAVAFVAETDERTGKLRKLLDRAVKELGNEVQFMTCDAQSAAEVADAYQLEQLPDLLVFDGKRVTERLYGIESYDELKNIVENGARRATRRS